jgi:hypothetical protein
MLASELRGRFVSGSGESPGPCEREASDAFEWCNVLASDVVEVLAVRLSTSLWNLRLVVASAGC